MQKHIINVSDLDPNWNWLAGTINTADITWQHFSSLKPQLPSYLPKRNAIARTYSGLRGTLKARKPNSILVSHGPRPTMYVSNLAASICPDVPHLAFSFTFTELPKGKQVALMKKAYKQPTRFVCYSNFEKNLYANYFDIPLEKIDMIHWSAHEPVQDPTEKPSETGRYLCALGTQGRDYKTLFEAMRLLPNIKLIAVVTPEYIQGLDIPENVIIRSNIPLHQAFNILKFSEFMVLPLRDSEAPCGHSTIVSSMFFKKSILITNAVTVYDYIEDQKTGLFFEANNIIDLKEKIEMLWENTASTQTMNEAAYQFAVNKCSEQSAANYFQHFLENYY